MRICAIGTSHLAAIKQGWDEIEGEFPDASITFFGAGGRTNWEIGTKGQLLIPKGEQLAKQFALTSGGASSIDVRDYDVFVLVGFALHMIDAVRVANSYRPESCRLVGGAPQFVTDDLFIKMMTAPRPGSLNETVAVPLKLMTKAPVYYQAFPFHNEWVLTQADTRFKHYQTFHEAGEGANLARLFTAASRAFCDGRFIASPPAATAHHMFTALPYSRSDTTGEPVTPDRKLDFSHMNTDYGRLAVRNIFDSIARG